MSIETMTKIATYTVPTGGVASYTFSNIPQTYSDLVVKVSVRTTASEEVSSLNISLNGSSVLFTGQYHVTNGGGTFAGTATGWVSYINGATSTASIFGNSEIIISNYSSNHYKTITSDSTQENNGSTAYMGFLSNVFTSPSPVTTVNFVPSSGSFAEFSTFTLYGVKNFAKSIGKVKASGGIITVDGTYVTHTFKASGLFYAQQDITPEVLVVAGGGGGGWSQAGYQGGGGGAGGLLYGTMALAPGSYTVTVGAGGTWGPAYTSATGGTGGSSVFNASTAVGGGGGGRGYAANLGGGGAQAGAAGGSGGGGAGGNAGGAATQTTSSGLTGFGFAGSAGADGAGGGAGGGAGAAATQSGYDVTAGIGKTYFGATYAAGGGRDTYQGQTGADTSGTANTGNGAGRSTSGTTTNGGSGIVIVRYKA